MLPLPPNSSLRVPFHSFRLDLDSVPLGFSCVPSLSLVTRSLSNTPGPFSSASWLADPVCDRENIPSLALLDHP